jgi:hypothetical protein
MIKKTPVLFVFKLIERIFGKESGHNDNALKSVEKESPIYGNKP